MLAPPTPKALLVGALGAVVAAPARPVTDVPVNTAGNTPSVFWSVYSTVKLTVPLLGATLVITDRCGNRTGADTVDDANGRVDGGRGVRNQQARWC